MQIMDKLQASIRKNEGEKVKLEVAKVKLEEALQVAKIKSKKAIKVKMI